MLIQTNPIPLLARILTLGLLAGTLQSAIARDASGDSKRTTSESKLVLMHYMPWYVTPEVRGKWGGHWAGHGQGRSQEHDPAKLDAAGKPDIWSHYHPLIGTYDSSDPHVVECHLLQMKLAGVDGVIADWYGISDAADYAEIHHATQVLFEQARKLGMQFAVCYEDRTVAHLVERGKLEPADIPQHLTDVMRWLHTHWFRAEHYVKVAGRPLLLLFGPIHVHQPEPWDQALGSVRPRPLLFALHHLWQRIGADGGFTWVHETIWQGDPDPATITRRLEGTFRYPAEDPGQVIVSALPGYHDIYPQSLAHIPHRDGRTLRESLQVALNGPWPIVQLVTWNDYGEGTIIEPTHEFGYRFLEIIQQQRAPRNAREDLLQPADLRLPALLLDLRRKGDAATSAELDAIAVALAKRDILQARKLLRAAQRSTAPTQHTIER